MSIIFNVTGSWDKTIYLTGEVITGTISGNAEVTTSTTTETFAGPVDVPVVADNGETSVVTFTNVPVSSTVTSTNSVPVIIDVSRQIIDNSATPREWIVSEDKLSIASVA